MQSCLLEACGQKHRVSLENPQKRWQALAPSDFAIRTRGLFSLMVLTDMCCLQAQILCLSKCGAHQVCLNAVGVCDLVLGSVPPSHRTLVLLPRVSGAGKVA